MKKLVAVAAIAFSLAGVSPAFAERVDVPGVGYIETGADYVYAEGDNGNGLGPLSGFVYVSTSRVCADDNGSHGASASPTCAPA